MNTEEIALLDTIDEEESKRCPPPIIVRHYGLILGMFSGITFATCAFLVKLSHPTDPMLIVWCRSVLQFPIFLILSVYIKCWENISGMINFILIFVNSLFVTAAICLAFIAAQNIDVTDANSIIFCAPMIVSILAYFFLKEPCGYLTVFTVVIAVVGSLFSARPSFIFGNNNQYTDNMVIGNSCAFLSAISMSCYYIIIRKLANIGSFVILCSSAATSLIITSVYLAATWSTVIFPSRFGDLLSVFAVAVFGIIAHLMLTKALHLENAGYVSIARMLDVPFCFFLQYVFLHHIPNMYSIIGAGLICSCVVINMLSNIKQNEE